MLWFPGKPFCHWNGSICVERIINQNCLHRTTIWLPRKSLYQYTSHLIYTVYPKKYTHGYCFAVLCCGYTLTDFPISIRLTSLALWQSNDCPSASKATLMNMDKYFMWIHYERLHDHNKAKHNKTVYIFLGIYCTPICPYISCRNDIVCTGEWSSVKLCKNYTRKYIPRINPSVSKHA